MNHRLTTIVHTSSEAHEVCICCHANLANDAVSCGMAMVLLLSRYGGKLLELFVFDVRTMHAQHNREDLSHASMHCKSWRTNLHLRTTRLLEETPSEDTPASVVVQWGIQDWES